MLAAEKAHVEGLADIAEGSWMTPYITRGRARPMLGNRLLALLLPESEGHSLPATTARRQMPCESGAAGPCRGALRFAGEIAMTPSVHPGTPRRPCTWSMWIRKYRTSSGRSLPSTIVFT